MIIFYFFKIYFSFRVDYRKMCINVSEIVEENLHWEFVLAHVPFLPMVHVCGFESKTLGKFIDAERFNGEKNPMPNLFSILSLILHYLSSILLLPSHPFRFWAGIYLLEKILRCWQGKGNNNSQDIYACLCKWFEPFSPELGL